MITIFTLNLKKALYDPFLLFWSLVFPIAMTVFLGSFVKMEGYAMHILTAMTGVSVLSYAFMNTSFNIFMQRKRGVYNLLKVTPMPLYKYIISLSLSWALISLLCSFIVLFICALIFKLYFSFLSIIAFIPVIFIAAVLYIFLSFFISGICKDVSYAAIINNIVLMISMFLSGAYYPIEYSPGFVKIMVKINPFEYFVDAIRSSVYFHWRSYFIDISILSVFFIVFLILAVNTFRYTDK